MDAIFQNLLKIINEAVVVINDNAEIFSYNPVFEALTGYTSTHLLGKSPCALLDTNGSLQLEEWLEYLNSNEQLKPKALYFKSQKNNYQKYLIHPFILGCEKKSMLILLFDPGLEYQNSIYSPAAQSLINSFNFQRIKLHTLEEELHEDESNWKISHPDLMYALQDIDSTLAQLNRSLNANEGNIDLKSAVIEVMKLALNYWNETTHSNKADLARHSGLWKVYTNEDGWDRTQTMDRYLNLKTLPKYPRRRQVCRTAEYVLSHLTEKNNTRHALENALSNLRQQV